MAPSSSPEVQHVRAMAMAGSCSTWPRPREESRRRPNLLPHTTDANATYAKTSAAERFLQTRIATAIRWQLRSLRNHNLCAAFWGVG